MWITEQLRRRNRPAAARAAVLPSADGQGVCLRQTQHAGQLMLLCPAGYEGMPTEQQEAVVLSADGKHLCAGVVRTETGLKPGEIRLSSAGGAYILLRNNGEISLNGLTVSADGRLIDFEK